MACLRVMQRAWLQTALPAPETKAYPPASFDLDQKTRVFVLNTGNKNIRQSK
jgi:hypothetical protein